MTEKIIYKNKFFNIVKKENYYFYDENNLQVMILPVIDDKKFILVKQYRVPLKKNTYEFPAGGLLNKFENQTNAAIRELFEETGIKVKKKNIIKMMKISPNPQRQRKFVTIFLAKISMSEYKNRYKIKSKEIKNIKIFGTKKLKDFFKEKKIISGVMGLVFLNYLLRKKEIL
tara:strand:- start:48 stop:563 length:516 start_codon:yes stop_codon:yes gene_type:complete